MSYVREKNIYNENVYKIKLYFDCIYIYIYSFSRRFYPKTLTVEEYNKQYIIKMQTDIGGAYNKNV